MAASEKGGERGQQPKALQPGDLKYDAAGLIPAVIQDSGTGAVLMVAYMNREALQRTLDSGKVWFWSRSRQVYWLKGETSGNIMAVEAIYGDCDADTVLVKVAPRGAGVACHTGRYSCFFNPLAGTVASPAGEGSAGVLPRLVEVIKQRRAARPPGSYTASLLEAGADGIVRKFGEEALEVMIAYLRGGRDELAREGADLLYHLLVMLEEADLPLEAVLRELAERGRSNA